LKLAQIPWKLFLYFYNKSYKNQHILTKRKGKNDNSSKNFIRQNTADLLSLLIKIMKHDNFFAKLEITKLLNRLLRDPSLCSFRNLFLSNSVFLLGKYQY